MKIWVISNFARESSHFFAHSCALVNPKPAPSSPTPGLKLFQPPPSHKITLDLDQLHKLAAANKAEYCAALLQVLLAEKMEVQVLEFELKGLISLTEKLRQCL